MALFSSKKRKKKNLLSPCDYQHGVTGKARAVLGGLKLMQFGETL